VIRATIPTRSLPITVIMKRLDVMIYLLSASKTRAAKPGKFWKRILESICRKFLSSKRVEPIISFPTGSYLQP
jgi:hypothetical protein